MPPLVPSQVTPMPSIRLFLKLSWVVKTRKYAVFKPNKHFSNITSKADMWETMSSKLTAT